jgi:predicted ATPase/DNA-binding SARP family transcriptional activator
MVAKGELQLALLGEPELWLDGELRALPRKGMALLAYLALAGRPVTREKLAGLLWSNIPDAAARANLRVTLNRLPARLRDFLAVDQQTIAVRLPTGSWLDVAVLERATSSDRAAWEAAVLLYRGDFLEGFFVPDSAAIEEWIVLERERWRLLVIELLQRLAERALEQSEYDSAVRYARRILSLDSWREEVHRLLMHTMARAGRRSEALAQFEQCRLLLAENLGIEPSADTVALYDAIRENRLAQGSGPQQSAPAPAPHNLPAVTTSFVGRERELEQLASLLGREDGRLLTLVGPGGAGKTRLALATAVHYLTDPRFSGGVFLVPLADLPPESELGPAILAALGLPPASGTTPESQVLAYLREREILLLLDNCEHLLPQTGLLSQILAAAPGISLIVTSRERLGLYEEWVLEVEGLTVPPDRDEGWQSYSAPQLFIQRAQRTYLGFDAAAEREGILEICRLVAGLPLAIELAAAWVRTVPCRDIARSIAQNLELLSSELRNIPERQRSLHSAFDYSWALLDEQERQLLGRLAVFRGGFTLAAATDIAGAYARQLSRLVDKSMLQRQASGRYSLHELIRVLARERVPEPKWWAVQGAHAGYYLRFLAEQDNRRDGGQAPLVFQETALEIENCRSAWEWLLADAPTEDAIRLLWQSLPHLSQFYLRRGRYQEAVVALNQAREWCLASSQLDDGTPSLRALEGRLEHQLAKHEEAMGRYQQAQERLQAWLPELEAPGENAIAADAWELLGRLQRHLGDFTAAEGSFQYALAQYRQVGRPADIASVLNSLGVLAKNHGKYDEAAGYYRESLAIFREQQDEAGVAVALINLGNIANVQGDYEQARAYYQESYELARASENRSQLGITLLNLGSVALALGDGASAERNYHESLALAREMQHGLLTAAALDGLGQTYLLRENWGAANAHLQEALQTAVGLGSQAMILTALASSGRALVMARRREGEQLVAFVANHDGTPHHVRKEVLSFAADHNLALDSGNDPPLSLAEAARVAFDALAAGTIAAT